MQYGCVCGQCMKPFISSKKNARWCSVKCRCDGIANEKHFKRQMSKKYGQNAPK